MENLTQIFTDYAGKFSVGTKFDTKVGGVVVVLGKQRRFMQAPLYLVEFENTGYKALFRGDAISKGVIKDRQAKTALGVGFLGEGDYKGNEREYNLWYSMLHRCYSGRKPTYKDITVTERWLDFGLFLLDVPEICGYGKWLSDTTYQLDKDFSGKGEYCLDGCRFVTIGDNVREANNRKDKRYRWLEREVVRLQKLLDGHSIPS